jgi:branched-chain amino acid transport system permease protein
VLHVWYDRNANPADFGIISSSTALMMAILGGSGTLLGPLLGSVIIVFLREIVSGWTERWLIVLGLLYIFVVLFFPQGILNLKIFQRGGTVRKPPEPNIESEAGKGAPVKVLTN